MLHFFMETNDGRRLPYKQGDIPIISSEEKETLHFQILILNSLSLKTFSGGTGH